LWAEKIPVLGDVSLMVAQGCFAAHGYQRRILSVFMFLEANANLLCGYRDGLASLPSCCVEQYNKVAGFLCWPINGKKI
jgi:hypothetical protein